MCTSAPKVDPVKPTAAIATKDTEEATEAVSKEDSLSRRKGAKRKGKKSLRIDSAGVNSGSSQSGVNI